jgi:cathepsin L
MNIYIMVMPALTYLMMFTNLTDYIINFNGTHKLEINKFINKTYHQGFKPTYTSTCEKVASNFGSIKIDEKLDWRDEGVVTPVKDQGHCGSCWSFSATGAMEGIWAIHSGDLLSFSEQELMDCSADYNNMGCNGGEMSAAFRYAIDNGVCNEDDVPYKTKTHSCMNDRCENRTYFSDCKILPHGRPSVMMRYIQFHPLSAAIQANHPVFTFYKSGVITTPVCGDNPDHGVLIVGYGTEDGIDYWLVKNSWGTDWGDNGYVKIGRDMNSNDYGVCGIASDVSFPLV